MSKKKKEAEESIKNVFKNLLNTSENNICICCKNPFTDKNVYSEAGWRETKITQMCEKCFDDATLSDEDIHD